MNQNKKKPDKRAKMVRIVCVVLCIALLIPLLANAIMIATAKSSKELKKELEALKNEAQEIINEGLALQKELDALPSVKLDIEEVAKDCGNPRGANMVLLGMAAPAIGILSVEDLRNAIATVFARKGEQVVEANLKAFIEGTPQNVVS